MYFYLDDSYLSIPEEFEWKDIPDFAIIMGKNGSGKSQLLESIYNNVKHLLEKYEERKFHKDNKLVIVEKIGELSKSEVIYINAYHDFCKYDSEKKKTKITMNTLLMEDLFLKL